MYIPILKTDPSPTITPSTTSDIAPKKTLSSIIVGRALPTIIEDNVFLGAMSEVVEGVIVGEGSVLSMGMYIGQSTKIVDRKTGAITYGKIPPYSVVVPGSLPDKNNSSAPSLYCAVIIKQVDEKTRSKTSVNDLLRE